MYQMCMLRSPLPDSAFTAAFGRMGFVRRPAHLDASSRHPPPSGQPGEFPGSASHRGRFQTMSSTRRRDGSLAPSSLGSPPTFPSSVRRVLVAIGKWGRGSGSSRESGSANGLTEPGCVVTSVTRQHRLHSSPTSRRHARGRHRLSEPSRAPVKRHDRGPRAARSSGRPDALPLRATRPSPGSKAP